MARRATCSLGALAFALVAATAAANGRFPRAQRLIQDREDPSVMALYGTYGLLVTRDAGASWRHVCEAATGTYAGEDPLLEIMEDQRIVLRTDTGLGKSDPSLCSYDAVLGSASLALQDITRDSAGPNGLLALSTSLGADGAFVSSLSSSTDGGETFTPLGSVPPDVIELALTLDVAPNRPELIYVSGFDELGRGKLARSTDRGQNFVGFEISGLGVAAPPYIAAVSALDPNRVFVRTDEFQRADDFEARETANDSLYFTPDGGTTWHRALNERGKLFGFALSPDERFVLAGYGDPVLPATFVEPDELGLYRVALEDLVASPDDPPWQRIYGRGVTCLRWTEQALFACVAQDENGFEVGRAPDANFSLTDAAPFQALLRLPEVRPLECPAESDGAACLLATANGWPVACTVLRAECSLDGNDGKPEPPATGAGGTSNPQGEPTLPAGDSGAASGMGGDSSSASVDGPAGAASDPGSSRGDGPARTSSGSCSVVARPRGLIHRHTAAWWLCALLLAARRRSRPRRDERVLIALLALAALSISACSDEAPPPAESGSANDNGQSAEPDATRVDCAGAGEDFVLGMSKATPSGTLTVALEAAEPAPPLAGNNSWTVRLSSESGEAVTAADVTVTGWMPAHRHGLNALPLTRELGGGRYEIQPIILYMPQLWELGVVVTRDDEREVATFSFCVP